MQKLPFLILIISSMLSGCNNKDYFASAQATIVDSYTEGDTFYYIIRVENDEDCDAKNVDIEMEFEFRDSDRSEFSTHRFELVQSYNSKKETFSSELKGRSLYSFGVSNVEVGEAVNCPSSLF
ncbi:MAG: hypothetical protein HQK65_18565 [Desulfamplus sp.]|nr:hypothetical protein [Desulfamplus sp.]